MEHFSEHVFHQELEHGRAVSQPERHHQVLVVMDPGGKGYGGQDL